MENLKKLSRENLKSISGGYIPEDGGTSCSSSCGVSITDCNGTCTATATSVTCTGTTQTLTKTCK